MRSRRSRVSVWAPRVVVALALLLVGVWLGGHPSWLPPALRGAFVDDKQGRLVAEVLGDLSHDYYKPLNTSQLANKGLAAAVASLKDPYSYYLDPAGYHQFLNQSSPHVSGIGVDVVSDPQGLKVVDVFPNTPASRAGIQAGDVIVEVSGTALAGKSADAASNLIKGRPGTRVTLTVLHGSRRHVLTIVRQALVVPVASGTLVTYHGVKVGHVTLTQFDDGAGSEVRRQVQSVLGSGAKAIILDLRDDGGGLLDEAVNVASIFIPDGTIVSTAGRSQPRQVYIAKGGAISTSIPVVVLVNRGTASASEIVTGALQDRGRAKVVGTQTYGKGVFQEVRELSNGGALHITVGEYFTPNGHNLGGGGVREGAGIKPNVYALDNPHTSVDEALVAAERTVTAQVR
jgi:carboxyl-terminal processing protease